MARKLILHRVVWTLVVVGFLAQFVAPLARIATTYLGMKLGLDGAEVGMLAAAYALWPVVFAVLAGRLNDRHGALPNALAGSALVLLSILFLGLGPESLTTLFVGVSGLGLGQMLQVLAFQEYVVRSAGHRHRDSVLGHFVLALSLGASLAPLTIGVLGTDDMAEIADRSLSVCAVGAILCMAGTIALARIGPHGPAVADAARPSLAALLRTDGLWWITIASSLCVASKDLFLVFLPAIGVERSISVQSVAVLLSINALATMFARLLYGRLVQAVGHARLAMLTMLLLAVSLAGVGIPLPYWVVTVAVGIAGLCLGISIPLTVSLVVRVAPVRARGAALSVRMTLNRLGQFVIPLGASLAGASLGAGAVVLAVGGCLTIVVAGMPKSLSR